MAVKEGYPVGMLPLRNAEALLMGSIKDLADDKASTGNDEVVPGVICMSVTLELAPRDKILLTIA